MQVRNPAAAMVSPGTQVIDTMVGTRRSVGAGLQVFLEMRLSGGGRMDTVGCTYPKKWGQAPLFTCPRGNFSLTSIGKYTP